jgi:phosphoglucomutase
MNHLAAAKAGFETVAVDPDAKKKALEYLRQWLTQPEFGAYRPQIEWLIEQKQWAGLIDRFYQILPFGTGGRRGAVGVGPNRMNPWTLAASVQGHCHYLKERFPGEPRLSVVLAFDVRRFEDVRKQYNRDLPNPLLGLTSKGLAKLAAQVYAANGIHSHLPALERPRYWSTPELSFAIRRLKAHGGLNISASHNPPDDNGGKFYDERGGQPIPPDDQIMADLVDLVKTIKSLPWNDAIRGGFITFVDESLHQEYIDLICRQSLLGPLQPGECMVVYTPLCGVGGGTVLEILEKQRFQVVPVADQLQPDGLFPGLASANPEVPGSMQQAVELAKAKEADLVLSSDPDADRIGAMIPDPIGWRFVNGNEIAALLTHFKLEQLATAGQLPASPLVICSMVTTTLVAKIARHFGCQVVSDLLVGFKYVADVLYQLEAKGRYRDVVASPLDLVIASEESHGILLSPEIRDKDAGGGSLLFAELAAQQKRRGRSVFDYLDYLYRAFGYHQNLVKNLAMAGILGKTQMLQMLKSLRKSPPKNVGGRNVIQFEDLQSEESRFGPLKGETDRANRNVLVFHLERDAKVTLRPSGTEPKAKAYVEAWSAPCPSGVSAAVWQEQCGRIDVAAESLANAFVAEALSRVGQHR